MWNFPIITLKIGMYCYICGLILLNSTHGWSYNWQLSLHFRSLIDISRNKHSVGKWNLNFGFLQLNMAIINHGPPHPLPSLDFVRISKSHGVSWKGLGNREFQNYTKGVECKPWQCIPNTHSWYCGKRRKQFLRCCYPSIHFSHFCFDVSCA